MPSNAFFQTNFAPSGTSNCHGRLTAIYLEHNTARDGDPWADLPWTSRDLDGAAVSSLLLALAACLPDVAKEEADVAGLYRHDRGSHSLDPDDLSGSAYLPGAVLWRVWGRVRGADYWSAATHRLGLSANLNAVDHRKDSIIAA